jgi:3-hydroxybutyryl-CoA dehydrogenase
MKTATQPQTFKPTRYSQITEEPPAMTANLPSNIDSRPVAVVGAGTLGRRIALMFATQGGEVRIFDMAAGARKAAVTYVEQELPKVIKTVVTDGTAGAITACDDLAETLKGAWLVVEAVPELLDLKKQVFGQLDALADQDAVLASNSSSYPTRTFLDNVKHPERLLNLHFYMPPDENAADIMGNEHTDHRLIELLLQKLPRFGVHPFEAHKESVGFIFNRIWAAIKRESLTVVAEGVSTPRDVDEMWKLNMGSKSGPFRLMDAVGLDIVLEIENHYLNSFPNLPTTARDFVKRYVDAGKIGRKSGEGFYNDYRDDAQSNSAPSVASRPKPQPNFKAISQPKARAA